MKHIATRFLLFFLAIILASCNTFVAQPTVTPAPTETPAPTSTNTPEPTPTQTLTPTRTAVPSTETPEEPILPIPSGQPAKEWQGIPVMPKAIAGQGDSKGYTFTVKASAQEIQKFYESQLAKLGWKMFASGKGGTEAVILIFMKQAGTLSVSIIPLQDGTMYVLLVK